MNSSLIKELSSTLLTISALKMQSVCDGQQGRFMKIQGMIDYPFHLKVFGTRYRCMLRYASLKSLDSIGRFILEEVIKKGQRNISRLTKSFGLTERIMEDILADLIHRNYAGLDLASGEIIPLDQDDVPSRPEYHDRNHLVVWQDHSTGAIIPAEWITPYSNDRQNYLSLPPIDSDYFNSFLDAPDSYLISLLIRSERSLGFGDDRNGGWTVW